MAAKRHTVDRAARDELSRLLAAAYLRLLRSRAANSRGLAHMGPPDSAESRCYEPPRE